MHLYMYISISCTLIDCVRVVTVTRSSSGDVFTASSHTCHLFNSKCVDWFPCNKCQCYGGNTYFRGTCASNPSKELGCTLFLDGNQYYALKMTTLRKNIAYVVCNSCWRDTSYSKCLLNQESIYWNTRKWVFLFTEGRKLSDYLLYSTSNGILFMFVGDSQQRILYSGLLIKFSLTCLTFTGEWSTQYMLMKVAGERDYPKIPITAVPTTKFTTTSTVVKRTSTVTKKTLTQKISVTIAKHTAGKNDKNEIFTIILPITVTITFLILFCIMFAFFRHRRRNTIISKSSEKANLCSNDILINSYESNTSEFEQVLLPSYSDLIDLMETERPSYTEGTFKKEYFGGDVNNSLEVNDRNRCPSESFDRACYTVSSSHRI